VRMELRFEVNKPTHVVFDYLTDMQKFCSIHPIIHKIEDKGNNTYLIHETLKIGFIPFSFTYPAMVESHKEEQLIKIKATVFKLTKIEMHFKISANSNASVVNEVVHFNSIFPIKNTMKKIFRKQHTQLFKNMSDLK
jgi:carbon monoxide dehydrogenase subunit G